MGQRALQQRLLDRLQLLIGDLGTPASRPTATQCPSAVSLPAGVPAAGALARDVQFVGDFGLRSALREQLGGTFPPGLTGRTILGAPLSRLLGAAVGRHGWACSHTNRPPEVVPDFVELEVAVPA